MSYNSNHFNFLFFAYDSRMTASKLESGVRAGIVGGPKPAAELRLSVFPGSASLGKAFVPSIKVMCPCTSGSTDTAENSLSMLGCHQVAIRGQGFSANENLMNPFHLVTIA